MKALRLQVMNGYHFRMNIAEASVTEARQNRQFFSWVAFKSE